MAGVNKVILLGRLGSDPEVRTLPSGGKVVTFSIATSETYNNKEGVKVEQTEWHRIVLNNRLGEIAQQYLRKGSKVYIEGSLRTRKWNDANGVEKFTTEIRGDQMQMLDSKGGAGSSSSDGDYNQYNQGANSAPANSPAPAAMSASNHADMDDDLPF